MSSSSWSRWWNGCRVQQHRPHSAKSRRARLAVERLEDRSLFSANAVGMVLPLSSAVPADSSGSAPALAAHARPVSFTFQDVNGDGIPDLAITIVHTNSTLVFLSQEPGRWVLDLPTKTTLNPTWAGSFELQVRDGLDAPVILIVNRALNRSSMLVGYQQNSLLAPDPFSEPMWNGLLLVGSPQHPSERLPMETTALRAESEAAALDHDDRSEHEGKVIDPRLERPAAPAEPDPSSDPAASSAGSGSAATERRDGPVSSRIASSGDDAEPAAPESNGPPDLRTLLAAPVDFPAAAFPLALERSLPGPQPALESLEESNGAVVATLLVETPQVPPPSGIDGDAGTEPALPHFVIGADDAPRGSVAADQWSTLPPDLHTADAGGTGELSPPDEPELTIPIGVGSTGCGGEPFVPVREDSPTKGRVLESIVPPPVAPSDEEVTGPAEQRSPEGVSSEMTPALEAVFALGLWSYTRCDGDTKDSRKQPGPRGSGGCRKPPEGHPTSR